MQYRLSIPARINILGNPTDANEGDYATISAAVDLRASALIESTAGIKLELQAASMDGTSNESVSKHFMQTPPLPYDGELDLLTGAVNRLYDYSAELQDKLTSKGFHITAWSEVPRQSGLGGSTLFILLTLVGLRTFYNLDPVKHNDYLLAELAQRVEAKELGITCGFADRYVPLFGGIAYLDFRGKIHQKEIKQEPYVTYERLDKFINQLPLAAISTGIQRDSGIVHERMRPLYLEEYNQWKLRGGEPPALVKLMIDAWKTAWQGKIALLEGNLETFGELMNQNHHLVEEMMTRCGFSDGAGWANNILIQTARDHGALGAKLTGAGGGGSVFALTKPGEERKLVDIWKKVADELGLDHAIAFQPGISRRGIIIDRSLQA
jgi:galactokinase/mevalonate kinase-like predicted kinase